MICSVNLGIHWKGIGMEHLIDLRLRNLQAEISMLRDILAIVAKASGPESELKAHELFIASELHLRTQVLRAMYDSQAT